MIKESQDKLQNLVESIDPYELHVSWTVVIIDDGDVGPLV